MVTERSAVVKKILIVDDDQTLSGLLQNALATEDRVLITAPSINSAREILKNENVDLLLLDLYLPDGSGLNLLADIRKNGNGKSKGPSAIIMTAFGDWESHVKSYKLGAFYYLDKPFKLMQLRLLVETALSTNNGPSHA
jgi:DNA-binding response OmpR family regulator